MIKNLYKQRIKSLKDDYDKMHTSVVNKKVIVDEYIILIQDVLKDIESITENAKIEPSMKYIEIDKKSKYIEAITYKISEIQTSIQVDLKKIDKEKDILIEGCVEEHSNIAREDVLIEIDRIFNEK